jgi:hypothetical protein
MLRESAMKRHEKWCTKNPDNWTDCMGCAYLKQHDSYYIIQRGYDGAEIKRDSKTFFCHKLKKQLYPIKVQKMGWDKKYSEFDHQEPMPKECEHRSWTLTGVEMKEIAEFDFNKYLETI